MSIKLTFHPEDNRRRDLDNLISATKGLRDGISDALGIDDSKIQLTAEIGPIAATKHVVVEIST